MEGVGKGAFFSGKLAISRKRWEIGSTLLLIKSHMLFQIR